MSSCLSSGARTYSIDLEIVKSPASASSSARSSSHSSSPSSTLSESSNSPLAISTRKSRTPRKRPNQTYTEAAALLAAIYPDLFSAGNLRKQLCKHTAAPFYDPFPPSPDLLPTFPALDNAGFLLFHTPTPPSPAKSLSQVDPKFRLRGAGELVGGNCDGDCDGEEEEEVAEFDAGSILDEEVEEGVDSIMGNLAVAGAAGDEEALLYGRRLEFRFGARSAGALRRAADDGEWWKVPTVDVRKIVAPKHKSAAPGKTKKKKKLNEVGRPVTTTAAAEEEDEMKAAIVGESPASPPAGEKRAARSGGLGLKLSHDKVMEAWSDRSPYSDDFAPESAEAMVVGTPSISLLLN